MNYFALLKWAVEHGLRINFDEEGGQYCVKLTWRRFKSPLDREATIFGHLRYIDPELIHIPNYIFYHFRAIVSELVRLEPDLKGGNYEQRQP